MKVQVLHLRCLQGPGNASDSKMIYWKKHVTTILREIYEYLFPRCLFDKNLNKWSKWVSERIPIFVLSSACNVQH